MCGGQNKGSQLAGLPRGCTIAGKLWSSSSSGPKSNVRIESGASLCTEITRDHFSGILGLPRLVPGICLSASSYS